MRLFTAAVVALSLLGLAVTATAGEDSPADELKFDLSTAVWVEVDWDAVAMAGEPVEVASVASSAGVEATITCKGWPEVCAIWTGEMSMPLKLDRDGDTASVSSYGTEACPETNWACFPGDTAAAE